MADIAAAKRLLPATLGGRIAVRFVTVDPTRDTPRALGRWLARFDPDFVGLRASKHIVNRAERALYATASEVTTTPTTSHTGHKAKGSSKNQNKSGYQVNHSGTVYVFGPGERSVIYTGGTTPSEYAADFAHLLEGRNP